MSRLLLLVPTASYRASAFVEAAKHLEADLTLASDEPSSLAKFRPIDLITLDFAHPDRCADQIESFASHHPVTGIVAVDDQTTLAAATMGARLGLPHNPASAAYASRNKLVMRERLSEQGIPVPDFWVVDVDGDPHRFAATVEYPCVIKPLMLSASRGVIRVDTPDDFVAAHKRVGKIVESTDSPDDPESRSQLLVESYVDGWEVAVEGILTDGRLHIFTIFDKPDPLRGPYFPETIYTSPCRLPERTQNRIVSLAGDAIAALGLVTGPVHAELRGNNKDLWFIEVASRSIGGYCSRVLEFENGQSLEDVIVRHALDPRTPLPALDRRPCGVMMLQAPNAGLFRKARGLQTARKLDGVKEIIVSAYSGQRLSPLPEGFLYMGFVFARHETVEKVEAALRAAHNQLEFVIDPS